MGLSSNFGVQKEDLSYVSDMRGYLPAGSRRKPGLQPGSPTRRYTAAAQSTEEEKKAGQTGSGLKETLKAHTSSRWFWSPVIVFSVTCRQRRGLAEVLLPSSHRCTSLSHRRSEFPDVSSPPFLQRSKTKADFISPELNLSAAFGEDKDGANQTWWKHSDHLRNTHLLAWPHICEMILWRLQSEAAAAAAAQPTRTGTRGLSAPTPPHQDSTRTETVWRTTFCSRGGRIYGARWIQTTPRDRRLTRWHRLISLLRRHFCSCATWGRRAITAKMTLQIRTDQSVSSKALQRLRNGWCATWMHSQ